MIVFAEYCCACAAGAAETATAKPNMVPSTYRFNENILRALKYGLSDIFLTAYPAGICTPERAKWFYLAPDFPLPARMLSNSARARGSFDWPSQKSAFFRTDGSRLVWATWISAGTPSPCGC